MPKRKSRLSDEKPSSSYTQDDMFDAMSLNKDIMKGVHDYGFEKLSENQLNGIEAFCSGKSVLHIAEYEPGNTTIFCVGILQQLDISTVKCQGLVLVHNLTLAEEIRIEMLQLGRLLNVKVDVVGLLKEVVDPVHVLVGRPYDVLKLMQQKPKKVDDIASKLMPQKPKKVDDIASKLMPPKLEKVDDIASKLMPPKLEKVDDVASKLMPPKLEKVDDIASKLMPQKPEKDDDIASKSMQQKRFDFDMVKILVLDEADKMHSLHLDMVDEIFKLLPLQCEDEFQVGVFTETMPEKVDDIARKLMNDPWEIEGKKPDELSVQSIKKHLFVNEGNAEKEENEEWKFSALYKLYKEMRTDTRKIIVYVDALERIDEVRDRIKNEYQHEFLAAHKFMDQNARNKMKKKFSEENGVLITNEMLARGIIDVEQVDLVVNFDLPRDYLRRVGRFKGVSVVSFVTNEDWYYLIDFQTDLGVVFEQHITSEPVTPLLEEFPIERDESIKHFVYNGANEDAKFDELVYFLGEKLGTIETVFFVDNCERVSQLAKQLEQLFEKRWEVTITTQSDENSIDISLEFKDLYECKSRVRIITDEQCHKIDVTKVPFVVHYNIPETTDVFNQRIAWCGSEGTAMYIPTDRNWSSVFRIQRSCKVVLKWFPESLDTLFIQRSSVKQIYDDLPSEEEKLCFLFCCLFPKEYDISEDELFHYLMGENLLTVMVDTFEAARLHLHAIIVKLTSLRLLLQDKSERIVMHDVVHDVAIRIASDSVEDHGFIVKAGMIERFPPLVDFHECKRLSFITKIGSHITCSTTDTIKAAHLSTLSFKGNVKLVELHDDFFKETPSLLTLDLSGTSIKVLPKSITCLVKLRTMLLEDCHHFKSISLSEDLKMLEILSLRSSEIESFMVSGNVTTLKLLDLSYTSKLNHISWNIISRFTKLEELYLLDRSTSWGPEKIEPPNKRKGPSLYKGKDGGKKHKEDSASLYQKKEYGLKHGEGSATVYEGKEGGEEFDTSLNEMMEYGSLSEAASSLDRLTSLNICVRERECLSHKISPWENLARFKIFVGVTLLELKIYGIEEEVKLEKNMYIELGRQTVADWVKVLWGKTEFLLLKGTENLSSLAKLDPNPKQEMFSELKILILWKVRAGTSFISSDQLGRLQNLNKLVIKGFRHLKILIVFEKVRISNLAVSSVFPKLRYLKVSDCCALKFLFPVTVIHLFSQLEELYISDCSNMEEVIGVETNDGAILPKLRVLSLENLRKLSKFCQRNIDVYWPFLEKLTVEKCELLEDFLLSIRSVPRLTKVIIDNTCLCLLKNVHLCRIMNRSSGPERICLAGCLKLKDELLGQSYSALRSLTLSNREDTSLMPYNFLRRLSGVERLEVHNCESLEKMIDFQGEEKDSEEQVSSVDPSVASTSANNSEFSEFQPSIVFQNLTVLKVSGCHKLKYLLPERVLRDHMVQLREVSILSCSAMETIIEYDTSEDYDYADKDKEFFLNLRFLNVRFCHNLKYLLPMRMIRGMLKLEVLIILECNAMEMIITHESTEDDGDADKDKEVLPKLKDLYVKSLPQLSSFVGQDILFDWPSLTYICVKDCLGLKKLPLGAGSVPKLGASGWLGPKHWFDELEWNDQEIKSRLLKIRREWD